MLGFQLGSHARYLVTGTFLLVHALTLQAQQEQPSKLADKSTYNLFRPTPSSLLREMTTDRPDKTESPFTVDAGHFQLEMDLVSYTYDRYTEPAGGPRTESWAIAPFNIKAGLFNNVDLQLVVGTYTSVRTREPLNVSHQHGFGDLMPRLKVNFWGDDGGSTALGAMPWVKFPLNQDNLGNNSVEGGLIIPFSLELPAGFGLGAMTEVDYIRNDARSGHHPEFVNSITLNHGLGSRLEGYIEFFSSASTERDSSWIGTVDVGFTYALTPTIQLDAGINIGVTRSADDLNPFVGISFRY
jgi:hypothetical protein